MSPWEAPGHEQWADAAGAYVLGAMPADEVESYETHLATCAACRAEVAELTPAVDALPASVPPRPAPAALRARVMTEVRREAELLQAAGPEADRPAQAGPAGRRRFAWVPRWAVPALAAAALAAAFVVGDVVGNGGGAGGHRTVPVAASGAASGAAGKLVLSSTAATMTAEHLPAPPAGSVYQVWLKPRGGAPQPTSVLFVPRSDGTARVAVPPAASNAELVLVSAEPRGGSRQPTSAPVLTARIPS